MAYGAAESGRSDGSTSAHADWLGVTEELQRRVLAGAGVPPERMTAALYVLRAASQLFPGDEDVQRISLYARHNRASAGTLKAGDELPDAPLYAAAQPPPEGTEEEAPLSLRAVCAGPEPTLLVAGSWS